MCSMEEFLKEPNRFVHTPHTNRASTEGSFLVRENICFSVNNSDTRTSIKTVLFKFNSNIVLSFPPRSASLHAVHVPMIGRK